MRSLPKVHTLNQAVKQVIESNKSGGYIPTRFIQATGNGDAPDLLSVYERLLQQAAAKHFDEILQVGYNNEVTENGSLVIRWQNNF
jgi:hypothetical protein